MEPTIDFKKTFDNGNGLLSKKFIARSLSVTPTTVSEWYKGGTITSAKNISLIEMFEKYEIEIVYRSADT